MIASSFCSTVMVLSTVFALAALEDVPLGEISRRFRKSESWARVIYHRAGKKLAERMKDFL